MHDKEKKREKIVLVLNSIVTELVLSSYDVTAAHNHWLFTGIKKEKIKSETQPLSKFAPF